MADVELEGEVHFDLPGDGLASLDVSLFGEAQLHLVNDGYEITDKNLWAEMDMSLELGGFSSMESSLFGHVDLGFQVGIYKPSIPLPEAYAENFNIQVQPRIGGGCAITLKGEPDRVVRWYLVGNENGYEVDPVGHLQHAWQRTDSRGYCVNYYTASRNPADVGKVDRIIARYSGDAV